MIETLLLSIAMYWYPVTMPDEIILIDKVEDVRPVLDEYWADNGVLAVGLSVTVGKTCIIYAMRDVGPRAKEIYLHELAHCWGLNHEQIENIMKTLRPQL
jgi:predicted Zn-dependent protease with MMP-like domain